MGTLIFAAVTLAIAGGAAFLLLFHPSFVCESIGRHLIDMTNEEQAGLRIHASVTVDNHGMNASVTAHGHRLAFYKYNCYGASFKPLTVWVLKGNERVEVSPWSVWRELISLRQEVAARSWSLREKRRGEREKEKRDALSHLRGEG